MHNDQISPVSQGVFSGARDEEVRVFNDYISLRNYTPNHINRMININNITCGCETCIGAMFIQSDLNLGG